jgi:hypothetical protein
MHSSPSSFSVTALVQYAFFAVVVYVLAGAPLSNILNDGQLGTGTGVGRGTVAQDKIDSLVVPEKDLKCNEHNYRGVHILSREPLVVYIEGFLGEEESRHVIDVRYVGSCIQVTGLQLTHRLANPTSSLRRFGPLGKKPSTLRFDTRKKRSFPATIR